MSECLCHVCGQPTADTEQEADSLDAAWAAAEAALPEGYIINLHLMLDGTYIAGAHSARDGYPHPTYLAHDPHPTPAAALNALAEKLQEGKWR